MLPEQCDVVVVGAGNAAMCAALAAREHGAEVVVLERAPEDEAGGNTRFTAGAIRFAYDGLEDLRALMPDLSADEIARTEQARRAAAEQSGNAWKAVVPVVVLAQKASGTAALHEADRKLAALKVQAGRCETS